MPSGKKIRRKTDYHLTPVVSCGSLIKVVKTMPKTVGMRNDEVISPVSASAAYRGDRKFKTLCLPVFRKAFFNILLSAIYTIRR